MKLDLRTAGLALQKGIEWPLEILGVVAGNEFGAENTVDLRVNGKLVAHGEVVLVDDFYGVRITQVIGRATG